MKRLAFVLLLICGDLLAQPTGGGSPPSDRPVYAFYANLGTPTNGRWRWCLDCAATAPCTGGGSGAFAFRAGSAWNCNTGSGGGTTLPVADTQTIVSGSADVTKLLRFEVDGFTAGATRVITPPNSNTLLPVFAQFITFNGPTAARTVTLPDSNFTVAGLSVANLFTTAQTVHPLTDVITLTIRRNGAAQTSNIFEVQDEGNNLLSAINKSGVFVGNVTGNVTGNVSGSSGSSTGNSATATALVANPNDCVGSDWARGVDQTGDAECAQPAFTDISGSISTSQIPNTAVTPATYTLATITVDAQGRITSASNGSAAALPVVDTTSIAEGSSDGTKEVRFEVDGMTTGNVGVITGTGTAAAFNTTITGRTNSASAYLTGAPAADGSSNVLNITSTFPQLTAHAVMGMSEDYTPNAAGSFNMTAHRVRLDSGGAYVGSSPTVAFSALNQTQSSNANWPTVGETVNAAVSAGNQNGNGAGDRYGVFATASGSNSSPTVAAAVVGVSNNDGGGYTRIGVMGLSGSGGTNHIGGYFSYSASKPTFTSAALVANNSSVAAPIFIAQDNDADVFKINDGGSVSSLLTNGAVVSTNSSSENLTLSTAGTTTATSGNLAAATSRIKAILYRVTTTITTATDFSVKVTGGNNWCSIGTATTAQTGLTSGSTGVLVPCAADGNFYTSTATTLTVTTTGTPGAGAVRLVPVYEQYTAPTS